MFNWDEPFNIEIYVTPEMGMDVDAYAKEAMVRQIVENVPFDGNPFSIEFRKFNRPPQMIDGVWLEPRVEYQAVIGKIHIRNEPFIAWPKEKPTWAGWRNDLKWLLEEWKYSIGSPLTNAINFVSMALTKILRVKK